jgi:lactate permease
MLSKVTGINELTLSAMAGRQLPFFSLIVPVWLVWTMAGWRAALEIWPALLVCGGSFALMQFLVSNYHGPWLVDVIGGLVSLVALALFLRVWQPRKTWHFVDEPPQQPGAVSYTRRQVASAWVPWVLLSVFVFIWGLPQFKDALKDTIVSIEVPALHQQIARDYPAVPKEKVGVPEDVTYTFNWLTATGTGILAAAIVSSFWLGLSPGRVAGIFAVTCYRLRFSLFTIACMLAIAFTTRYSGMDATLGLAFTHTGFLYPLFAAMLGWLGVALTGSDTSSNALFGSMQTITAQDLVVNKQILPLSVEQAQTLMAAANSTGGVMGKMIDAQSIVVAAVATQQHNQEGAILRFVFWHSLVLAILMGILIMIQAYWWTSSIP